MLKVHSDFQLCNTTNRLPKSAVLSGLTSPLSLYKLRPFHLFEQFHKLYRQHAEVEILENQPFVCPSQKDAILVKDTILLTDHWSQLH